MKRYGWITIIAFFLIAALILTGVGFLWSTASPAPTGRRARPSKRK